MRTAYFVSFNVCHISLSFSFTNWISILFFTFMTLKGVQEQQDRQRESPERQGGSDESASQTAGAAFLATLGLSIVFVVGISTWILVTGQ